MRQGSSVENHTFNYAKDSFCNVMHWCFDELSVSTETANRLLDDLMTFMDEIYLSKEATK